MTTKTASTPKALVIYHAGCYDGFCCAWLFSKTFPCDYHAASYGTDPPFTDIEGRNVFIADFCYKRPVMRTIASLAAHLTVLDHHKTAKEDLEGFADEAERVYGLTRPEVTFDMTKSGGRLTWEYLYNASAFDEGWLYSIKPYRLENDDAPWIVGYTEDRDLWSHALPDSKKVNAALRSYPMDFPTWDHLLLANGTYKSWEGFKAEGAAILRREQQIVDQHVSFAREQEIGGHKVLAVNATVLSSEIAGALAKGRPFGACYFDRADGVRVWSLRSQEDGVDVSAVARSLGGGGHKHAAGYEEKPAVTV